MTTERGGYSPTSPRRIPILARAGRGIDDRRPKADRLSTTAAIYGHYDLSDLERALEALAKARRAQEEEPAD